VIGETEPHEAFARLTVAVLPLALTLVPLAALLIGISGAAAEDATGFLLSQPVSRFQQLLGRWLGQASALSVSLVAGFGSGAAIVLILTGATDGHRFAVLVAACVFAALAFLSVATLIVAGVSRQLRNGNCRVRLIRRSSLRRDDAVLALWATGTAGAACSSCPCSAMPSIRAS
jgi:hypothetical protein